MSRGPGHVQRSILDLLESQGVVTLGGATRAETSANVRAARQLERAGRCVLVRLWNGRHTHAVLVAFRPDYRLADGTDPKSLSVDRVPYGTRSTLTGSLRDIARQDGVSKTQIARDLARAAQKK